MARWSPSNHARTCHRKRKAAEASARAEAKALAAGTPDWAPFPGSGVRLATLRRLEAAEKIVYESKIEQGRIVCRFRTILTELV